MRFFVFLAFVFLLPNISFAQSLGGALGDVSPFSLSVTPQYPVPQGQAVVSFSSATLSLSNASLSVFANGKNIYAGSVRPVSVSLGGNGSVTKVVATITSGGEDHQQTIFIQPEDVSLVVEPIASVPALYPGKSRVPIEGTVRVIAIANLKTSGGSSLSPTSLSYEWSVDGAKIATASGIGKRTLVVAVPFKYRSHEVSVSITSQGGSVVGGSSVSFTGNEPFVRLYESDPLLGIRFEKALSGTYTIKGAESTLYAAPFSLSSAEGVVTPQWYLNGALVQTGNTITLRPSGTGQGISSLSVVASAGTAKATALLSLLFNTSSNTTLFGL